MPIYKSKHGIWLICNDTHRTQWVEASGSLYIDALIGLISEHIQPGDTVIDVGANIGDHTYFYMQKTGSEGRVIAFEPDHEAYACLVLNCGWSKDFHEAGAGSTNSKAKIIRHGNSGQNYLVEDAQSSIEIKTIDSLQLESCHLIKIDVEGAELEVLKGAEKTIKKHQPIIAIEIISEQLNRFNTDKTSLLNYLNSLGYTNIKPLRNNESLDSERVDAICLPSKAS